MRKTLLLLTCCTLVLLFGYAGYRGYKVWKQQHFMAMAKSFLAKPDERNALLCLQQVLKSNPRNLEATRMMANLTTAARSPSALLWRSRVVELNPRSLDDRLALAQAALAFRDFGVATNALAGIDTAGKNTAAYHTLAGAVAVAMNQLDQGQLHFLEAQRLEPTNQVHQLNLAVLRLHGTNDLDLQEARIGLQRILANPDSPELRCQAARGLVNDALRFKKLDSALDLSRQLMQMTNAAFADHVLRLEVLRQARSSDFGPALASCQREATTNTAKIYELAMWETARTSPGETLTWLRTLSPTIQTNQPVALLIAECFTAKKDWNGLQQRLQPQNWAELEFLRHAFLARALRGQALEAASKGEWEQALKAVGDNKQGLGMLYALSTQWTWNDEAEGLLWSVVERYPSEQWAIQALNRALFLGGRTRSLMKLYGQQLKLAPSNLTIKNNLAMTALLLDAKELKPDEMALDLYQKASTNATYASTYAFSLYKKSKSTEALKIMQQLKPRDLENPSIAGYYGLILKATGNNAKATPYLQWASKAPMLPEEKKMFEAAKSSSNS